MEKRALLQRVMKKAETDQAFRAALEKDPQAVLAQETGLSLQELRVQLSDNELADVTGGTGASYQRCPICHFSTTNEVLLMIHQLIMHPNN